MANELIYSLNEEDAQTVAIEQLGRKLSSDDQAGLESPRVPVMQHSLPLAQNHSRALQSVRLFKNGGISHLCLVILSLLVSIRF